MRWIPELVNWTLLRGVAEDGSGAGVVVDGSVDFLSFGVRPGYIVVKESTGESHNITAVSQHSLTLDGGSFAAGDPYRVLVGWPMVEGIVEDVQGNDIIDSDMDFIAKGVRAGFTVQVGNEMAWVTDVGDGRLTITRQIASPGDQYKVYPGDISSSQLFRLLDEAISKRLVTLAFSDAEVNGPGSPLISFRFLSPQGYGRDVITLFLEAKGTGTISIEIDGDVLAQVTVDSTDWVVLSPIEIQVDLPPSSSHLLAISSQDQISLRVVEVYG